MQYGKDPDLSLSTLSSASCVLCMCSSLFVLPFWELCPPPLLPRDTHAQRHPSTGWPRCPWGVWDPLLTPSPQVSTSYFNYLSVCLSRFPAPLPCPNCELSEDVSYCCPQGWAHGKCPESAFVGVANEEDVWYLASPLLTRAPQAPPWPEHCCRGGRRGFQAQDPPLSPQLCAGTGSSSKQE